jgi:hypothetical protein
MASPVKADSSLFHRSDTALDFCNVRQNAYASLETEIQQSVLSVELNSSKPRDISFNVGSPLFERFTDCWQEDAHSDYQSQLMIGATRSPASNYELPFLYQPSSTKKPDSVNSTGLRATIFFSLNPLEDQLADGFVASPRLF